MCFTIVHLLVKPLKTERIVKMKILIQSYCVILQIKAKNVCKSMKFIP